MSIEELNRRLEQVKERSRVTDERAKELLTQLKAEQEEQIDPDTAIVAFMGWLTSRDEVTGPFSGHHEAGQAAELVKLFCEAQGWKADDERFHRQIVRLKSMYPKEKGHE